MTPSYTLTKDDVFQAIADYVVRENDLPGQRIHTVINYQVTGNTVEITHAVCTPQGNSR